MMKHFTKAFDKIKLPKFSEKVEDFTSWRREFKNTMVVLDLDSLLEKDSQVALKNLVDTYRMTDEEGARLNSKFFSILSLSMDPETAETIENTKCNGNGIMAWKVILQIYESKNLLRMSHLRHKLSMTTLAEDGNLSEYISKIRILVRQLREGGDAIGDRTLITTIITGLPPSLSLIHI